MGEKYPIFIASWQDNWEKLSTYFSYTPTIRKLIYTTNPIESYYRQIRSITKTKGAFTSDMALFKLVYLATKKVEKKWAMPLPNWSLIVKELVIRFGNRMPIALLTKSTIGQSSNHTPVAAIVFVLSSFAYSPDCQGLVLAVLARF